MTAEERTKLAATTVGAAQRQLPPDIRALARDVPVLYEAKPGEDVIAAGFPPDILGYFTGNPYGAELDSSNTDSAHPVQIRLFLDNLWEMAEEDADIFREEVHITYLHELGHYLGWDEDEVAERGLD
jgi:predicted Zn-dependent protease with MMP-like domain